MRSTRPAVDGDDQILGPHAGGRGGPVRLDADHLDARVPSDTAARTLGGSGRSPPAMPT